MNFSLKTRVIESLKWTTVASTSVTILRVIPIKAPAELGFGSLKSERLSDCRFKTRRLAELEVLDYIRYYNLIRLHSTLGYKSPMPYEKELQRKAA
jgi:hypothetical protein